MKAVSLRLNSAARRWQVAAGRRCVHSTTAAGLPANGVAANATTRYTARSAVEWCGDSSATAAAAAAMAVSVAIPSGYKLSSLGSAWEGG